MEELGDALELGDDDLSGNSEGSLTHSIISLI